MDKNIKQYAKDNHLDYGTSAGQLYMLDGKAQANAERTLQSFQAVKDREQQAQQQRECMVNRNNPFDKCGQFWKDFGVGVSTGADAIARVGSLATKIPGVKDVPGVKEVIAGADALKGESVLDQGLKQLTGGLLAPTNRPRINARLQAVGLLPIPPLL